MADYPFRAGPQFLTTTYETFITVPGGVTLIWKTLRVFNRAATDETLILSIGSGDAVGNMYASEPLRPGQILYEELWIPLATGETISMKASANSSLIIVVGGVLAT